MKMSFDLSDSFFSFLIHRKPFLLGGRRLKTSMAGPTITTLPPTRPLGPCPVGLMPPPYPPAPPRSPSLTSLHRFPPLASSLPLLSPFFFCPHLTACHTFPCGPSSFIPISFRCSIFALIAPPLFRVNAPHRARKGPL